MTVWMPCGATLPTLGARFSVVALVEDHVSVVDWPRCTIVGAACKVTVGCGGGGVPAAGAAAGWHGGWCLQPHAQHKGQQGEQDNSSERTSPHFKSSLSIGSERA